jgi:isoamyl acetate esterase
VAQHPKIILLTPPPVNEYQLPDSSNEVEGIRPVVRTANHTKLYADAASEVASELGVPIADIWTAFMTAAGWQEGLPLVGSREIPINHTLSSFFTDGLLFHPSTI